MNLFVYGTLLFPEIREWVSGRRHRSEPAVLKGFRVRRVRNATFPGIVRVPESGEETASGEVLFDLTETEFAMLDRYEDDFYVRSLVSLTLENGAEIECFVYEVPPEEADHFLSDDPWTREWFRENHYEDFVGRWK